MRERFTVAVVVLLGLLMGIDLTLAQQRQRIPRLETTQEFRVPQATDCNNLTSQRLGNMCFDTDADPDNDGTSEGQTLYYVDTDNDGTADAWSADPVSSPVVESEEVVFEALKASAGTITAGQVVYVAGISGTTSTVELADADMASTMPAIGVAKENITNSVAGTVVKIGDVVNVDTSGACRS